MPASSLNFPSAAAVFLTPARKGGFHPRRSTAQERDDDNQLSFGDTAFSVSYYRNKACTAPSMIQELSCPNHCDTTSIDNGSFFTSRVCLAEAAVTANTAQLVWISVSSFAVAILLGAGLFVYMRRRAHGLPLRGKELWTEAEEDGKSSTNREYSTF